MRPVRVFATSSLWEFLPQLSRARQLHTVIYQNQPHKAQLANFSTSRNLLAQLQTRRSHTAHLRSKCPDKILASRKVSGRSLAKDLREVEDGFSLHLPLQSPPSRFQELLLYQKNKVAKAATN